MKLEVINYNHNSKEVEVIDSRLVAQKLNIKHVNFMANIKHHLEFIEERHGTLLLQKQSTKFASGGVSDIHYYLLTEDQAIFLTTLSRNTEEVMETKSSIVTAFSNLRREKEQSLISAQPQFITPKTWSEALFLAAQQAVLIETQTIKIEEDRPKVAYYDDIIGDNSSKDLKETAALLKLVIDGKPVGRNELHKMLQDDKYLMKPNKYGYSMPYRQFMETPLDFFQVHEKDVKGIKNTRGSMHTRVTVKGLKHLHSKYKGLKSGESQLLIN